MLAMGRHGRSWSVFAAKKIWQEERNIDNALHLGDRVARHAPSRTLNAVVQSISRL